jgi:predicted Rossmann fold flavoprotein
MTLAIIGAGASGLVAATEAAKRGFRVTVYEKNAKVGRKILATGNGRCNISNQNISISNYHGATPAFANPTIARFGTKKCIEYFSELGLEMIEGENGRLYPMNQQSSSVVDMLFYECKRRGVEFLLQSEVDRLENNDGKFSLSINNKNHLYDYCLIATGGLAMPALGSNDSGYRFALSFGHKLISPRPSLVQLVCEEAAIRELSGVKVDGNIEVWAGQQKTKNARGDILFTNYGISGSAVLEISSAVSSALFHDQKVFVTIDLMPDFSKEQLEGLLQKRLKHANEKSLTLWLEGIVNKKLASFIIHSAQLSKQTTLVSMLGAKEIKKLCHTLKNIKLHITDTKGFQNAEVTAGGVDVEDINPHTFESKLVKNLYFSGEVLDIDGDCGGYNLHFAWASGFIVGQEIRRTKQ